MFTTIHEIKVSYYKTIENKGDSNTLGIIDGFLQIAKDNDYKLTEEIEHFREEHATGFKSELNDSKYFKGMNVFFEILFCCS